MNTIDRIDFANINVIGPARADKVEGFDRERVLTRLYITAAWRKWRRLAGQDANKSRQ